MRNRTRQMLVLIAAAATALPLTGVIVSPASATTYNVNVVGYSVVGPAYHALEAAFQATPAGQNVTFTNSFGASDTETSNVIEGQPADLVNLSYETNIAQLVAAHKVPTNWATQELSVGRVNAALTGTHQQTVYPTPGIVTDTVVVFVVRKGNPLHIANWSNLVQHGIQLVTPDPLTSGSAKWNLLGAYSSQISLHRTPNQAQSFLKGIIENTISQPASGSSAMSAFTSGVGNVLLDYEDDALAAIAASKPVQIVTPPQTMLIENPIALTTTGVTNPGAKAFYKYLYSAAGQGIFASLGYRSVLKTVWTATKNNFPAFKNKTDLLTVENLNRAGWPVVDPEFFSPTVKFGANKSFPTQGIVTYLEQFAGKTA
jgi:sulfate/thiosulfate transport system substrate-binding protein